MADAPAGGRPAASRPGARAGTGGILTTPIVLSILCIPVCAGAVTDPGVPVTYRFAPDAPAYDTFRITFRNARKPRPLFVCGRNAKGSLTVTFQDLGGLERFAGGGASDLLQLAVTKGEFSATGDKPSAPPVGEDEFACAAWLLARPRPSVDFEVKSVTGWAIRGKRPAAVEGAAAEVYSARVEGELVVGERRLAVRSPGTVTITDAGAGAPAGLEIRAGFAFAGERMGLVGEDAGDIDAELVMRGVAAPGGGRDSLPVPGGDGLDLD